MGHGHGGGAVAAILLSWADILWELGCPAGTRRAPLVAGVSPVFILNALAFEIAVA